MAMDKSRLRPGELLAAAGGVLLLVALVLDWYGGSCAALVNGRAMDVSVALNAWEAFDVLDVLLALAALGGIALAVLEATQRSPTVPNAAGVITTSLALLLALAVLYRWLNQPGPNDVVGVEPGLYLGLLALGLLFFGAYRSLADESARRTPAPHVEVRPAPPPDVKPAGTVTDAPPNP